MGGFASHFCMLIAQIDGGNKKPCNWQYNNRALGLYLTRIYRIIRGYMLLEIFV